MVTAKSTGVTATERLLAEFCERSFLKLWSYPNPYKDDAHELCDLLAVFENHVFIFFDRENELADSPDKDQQVLWDRWKRNVIDRQVRTAHGAERYIRSGRPIFLDGKGTAPFPLPIDSDKMIVHKIIIAHGAKEACENASNANVYGSLAITYSENDGASPHPFMVEINKRNPVHIFDSHNLPIILGELDTVYDFASYLDAKLEAVAALDALNYCGEEDLLAHYYLNYDSATKRHLIGTKDPTINCVMIGEGEWHDFIETETYRNTKRVNRMSYMWDELIQRTCQNAMNGTLGGNSDLIRGGPSAIYEMAKEPRFVRRAIADRMIHAIESFPDSSTKLVRNVSFIPSFYEDRAYVFLQLKVDEDMRAKPYYREKRQTILEIACGAAKNKFPNLKTVIGIAIDAPKFVKENSEDFILLPCEVWTDEMRAHYEAGNEGWDFFRSPTLKEHRGRVTEFLPPCNQLQPQPVRAKTGRNDLCPCGSGKKFKKCCGG
jgi:hypothetical protein